MISSGSLLARGVWPGKPDVTGRSQSRHSNCSEVKLQRRTTPSIGGEGRLCGQGYVPSENGPEPETGTAGVWVPPSEGLVYYEEDPTQRNRQSVQLAQSVGGVKEGNAEQRQCGSGPHER